jgi:hypothetical protein
LTAERYILGELSAVERDRFEEHYFECPECADAIRILAALREGTRTGLCPAPETAVRERKTEGRWLEQLRAWWWQPQGLIAVVALAVAAVTTWQNIQMQQRLQPQILRSVTLQPASRGAMANVRSGNVSGLILLEADLPGAAGDLTWNIKSADGKQAAAGTGSAPEPGLSMKILVPARDLPAADYTLEVRSGSGREWTFTFHSAPQ